MFGRKNLAVISNDFYKKEQLIDTWVIVEKNLFSDITVSYNNARQVLELLLGNVQLRINGTYDDSLSLFERMSDENVIKFLSNSDVVRRLHDVRKKTNQGSHSGLKDRPEITEQDGELVYVDLCIALNYILLLLKDIDKPIIFDIDKIPRGGALSQFFSKFKAPKTKSRNFQNKFDYSARTAPTKNNNQRPRRKNTSNQEDNTNKQTAPKPQNNKTINKLFDRKYKYDDVMKFGESSNLKDIKDHLEQFFTEFNPTEDQKYILEDFNNQLQVALDKNKYSTSLVFEKFDFNFELNDSSFNSTIQLFGQKGADMLVRFELKDN